MIPLEEEQSKDCTMELDAGQQVIDAGRKEVLDFFGVDYSGKDAVWRDGVFQAVNDTRHVVSRLSGEERTRFLAGYRVGCEMLKTAAARFDELTRKRAEMWYRREPRWLFPQEEEAIQDFKDGVFREVRSMYTFTYRDLLFICYNATQHRRYCGAGLCATILIP